MFLTKLFRRNPIAKAAPTHAATFDQGFVFDPLSDDFIANPYPILAHLREHAPVHRCVTGAWVLTRYEDVLAALSDKRLSNAPAPYAVVNQRNADRYVCAQVANNILPFLDGELHQRIRFVLGRSFFKAIKDFQGESGKAQLERLALDILTPLLKQPEFDVIHDFGTPFSGRVMCQCMGFDEQDLPKLAQWSEMFLYLFSVMPSEDIRAQVDQALTEFRLYLKGVLEQKRRHPADDWISALLADNQGATTPLTDSELIDAFMLFFADGLENVDRFLGTVFKLLFEQPEQLALVKADHSLIGDLVDECLRYDPPAQFIGRIATEDITLHGHTIKAHSAVFLMLGSANRDPQQYPDADTFDLNHGYKNTLEFGRGHHSCFGKNLVRYQMIEAVRVILSQCPELTLAQQSFQWEKRLAHRWLTHCALAPNHPR